MSIDLVKNAPKTPAREASIQSMECSMAGDQERWLSLFADDAVLEDPIFGSFDGTEAITGFFAKMNEVVPKAGCVFEAVEIQGGDTSAWCKWVAKYDDGRRVDGGEGRIRETHPRYFLSRRVTTKLAASPSMRTRKNRTIEAAAA